MVRMFLFLAAAELVLVALALISCLSADRSGVRGLPPAAGVLVILLVPVIGPVAWFVAGRPRPAAATRRAGRRPPASPDDDPEFLRSLNADRSRRDRDLFDAWERDLHDRERPGPPQQPPAGPAPGPPGTPGTPAAGTLHGTPADGTPADGAPDGTPDGGRPRDGESTQPDA